jgi:hypothetical protein
MKLCATNKSGNTHGPRCKILRRTRWSRSPYSYTRTGWPRTCKRLRYITINSAVAGGGRRGESLGARGVSSWNMCSGRVLFNCDAEHWRWEGGCVRIWKQTIRTAESPVSGTAKKLGGADLGMSATELQAEEGRGCARVYDRTCASVGRGCDSQLSGEA